MPLDHFTRQQLIDKLQAQRKTLRAVRQVLDTFGVGGPGEPLDRRVQQAITNRDRAMKIVLRKIEENRDLRRMVDDLFEPPT